MTIEELAAQFIGCDCNDCVANRTKLLTDLVSEIKKRCKEECEKQMILPDDWKDMAEFNNGCKHCIQAVDRMEVE